MSYESRYPKCLVLCVRRSVDLSDISCHMGRGLLHKNVIIAFDIWDSDCCTLCTVWLTKAQEDRSPLGKPRASRKASSFYLQFTVRNPMLMTCTYNYTFCNLVRGLRLEGEPVYPMKHEKSL